MGGMSVTHWLVVGVIAILLFGRGRFSAAAGDIAKGLKSFKREMSHDDGAQASDPNGSEAAPDR